MLSGGEQTALFLKLTTILIPMGMYFLLLGVLNSRRHPQLLTGRRDFTLLLGAFSPMVILPVLSALAAPAWVGAAVVVGVLAIAGALAPRSGRWVIYNLPADQARQVVRGALEGLGVAFTEAPGGFLVGEALRVQVSAFGLLRNVSLHMTGLDEALQGRLCQAIAADLLRRPAETCPATVAMMLAAIGMMVAPLVLVAHRAGDIVRIGVDLLP